MRPWSRPAAAAGDQAAPAREREIASRDFQIDRHARRATDPALSDQVRLREVELQLPHVDGIGEQLHIGRELQTHAFGLVEAIAVGDGGVADVQRHVGCQRSKAFRRAARRAKPDPETRDRPGSTCRSARTA